MTSPNSGSETSGLSRDDVLSSRVPELSMSAKATTAAAQRIAPRLTRTVGLDPLTIVTILTTLLPLLASCFKCEEDDDPQTFLRSNFNASTGQFGIRLIRRCRPQSRKAARQNGQRGLSQDQIDEISHQALLEAMNGDKATVSKVLAEAE